MNTPITSFKNPLVKNIVRLQQNSSERKATGTFVVEGRREVSQAIKHGIVSEMLIVCPEIFSQNTEYPIPYESHDATKTILVSLAVYNKIAYRKGVEGVMLLGKNPRESLEDYHPGQNPLIVVLEDVEKPGNLGAILRTTDAAGIDAVLLCNMRTDLYNPNAIRASLGCVFSQKVIECQSHHAFQWLKDKGINILAAAPLASDLYFDTDFRKPSAIAFGAEDRGLSPIWLEEPARSIKIPMNGSIDSLNVAASVAIVAFEAVRQRNTKR